LEIDDLRRTTTSAANSPAASVSDVGTAKAKHRDHYFADRPIALHAALVGAPQVGPKGDEFVRTLCKLDSRDAADWLAAVWEGRRRMMESKGLSLTEAESAGLRAVFVREWTGFQAWAQGEFLVALEATTTMDEFRAARHSWQVRYGEAWALLTAGMLRAGQELGDPALYERIERFF
jgi:hypothetical protein